MENVIQIDLNRCFWELLKKSYILILCGVLLAGVGFAATANRQNVYVASASIWAASYGSYTESLQGINIAQRYTDIVSSNRVSERASMLIDEELSAQQIAAMISATYKDDSPTIYISARSLNPELAIRVANAVAESMVIEVQNITGNNAIKVLDEATRVGMVSSTSRTKVCIIAFLVGFFIPAIVIVLKETFSDNIYRVDDASLDGQLQVIGIIPENDKIK